MNWKRGTSSSAILALLIFLAAGFSLYQARQYSSAAPNAKTMTAHVSSVHHSIFRGLRFNYYSCSYDFSVNGSLIFGLRDCPQWIIDDAVKGNHLGYAANWAGRDAVVYYDPANPSRNSLLDFRTQSQIAYRVAMPWVALAGLIVFFFVLGKLMEASELRERTRLSVDDRGEIYAREIGPSSGSESVHPKALNSDSSQAIRRLSDE